MFWRSVAPFGLRRSASTAAMCMILIPPEPTRAAAAFFGDMLHGWDWQCCAERYPDLWSKFGGDRTFFDRRQKYWSHWHKVLDERECTCPLDFWRSKHLGGDCANRKELTRLKAEVQEERQEKAKLRLEVESQRRKVDALKRKTEDLQSQSMIARLEATRLYREKALLKSKANCTADLADLTAQLLRANDKVQNLTASIAAQSRHPGPTGYGEHVLAVVVIVVLAVVFRVAGQAGDIVMQATDLDSDPAAAACSTCSRTPLEEEADTVAANVETDGLLGNVHPELDIDMFDEHSESETLRSVTIACPGASQEDITVSTLFNGCAVAISCCEGPSWTKSFQFRPEDGCFELEEQRVCLEQGRLLLVFRACPVPSRVLQLRQGRTPEEQEAARQGSICSNTASTATDLEEDSTTETTQAVLLPDSDNGSDATFDPANMADNTCLDGILNEHIAATEQGGLGQGGSMTVEDNVDFWAADEEPPEAGTMATDDLQTVPNLPVNDTFESGNGFEQFSASDEDEDFEIIFHEGAEHRA